jgi:hypothetical protein
VVFFRSCELPVNSRGSAPFVGAIVSTPSLTYHKAAMGSDRDRRVCRALRCAAPFSFPRCSSAQIIFQLLEMIGDFGAGRDPDVAFRQNVPQKIPEDMPTHWPS